MTGAPTRRQEFWAGARATLALVVGATPFAVLFGALATTSGLSARAAVAMSLFVFAGSAQFIAVTLLASGTGVALIILTTLIVNLRHVLYAATLAPHVRHLPQRWLLPLGFWLTDESFVVVAERFNRRGPAPYKHWYYLGSALFMYVNWQIWTIVGILAGQRIPDPSHWGLDFALVATFIGLLVPQVRTRPMLAAALVAGGTAALTAGLPNKLGLIVAALVGVAAGVAVESRAPRAEEGSP